MRTLVPCLFLALPAACGGVECGPGTTEKDGQCVADAEPPSDADADADADSDADADADADSDADADADSDADADADSDADADADADADTDTDTDTDTGTITDTGPFDDDGDGVPASVDCDDDDPLRYPGAPERCNGLDDDCDGSLETGLLVTVDDTDSFPTLAEALASASAGADVVMCPGTYNETVQVGQSLTIRSRGGAAATILDGLFGFGAAVIDATLLGQDQLTVEGLTIRNGGNRGILMAEGSTLELVDTIVSANAGGIAGSDITLTRSDVIDNNGFNGSGIHLYGGTLTCDSSSQIEGNGYTTAIGIGGGVYVTGDAVINGCDIRANESDLGGGIGVVDGASLELIDTTVASNEGTDGGGVYLSGPSLIGGTITGNDGRDGGGIHVAYEGAVLDGVTLDANIGLAGGGVHFDTGGSLLNAVVTYNSGGSTGGGGIYVDGDSVLIVSDTTIEDNICDGGGGLWLDRGARATLTNGTLIDNVATSFHDGGGAFVDDGGLLELVTVDVGGNSPDDMAGDFFSGVVFTGVTSTTCDDSGCY